MCEARIHIRSFETQWRLNLILKSVRLFLPELGPRNFSVLEQDESGIYSFLIAVVHNLVSFCRSQWSRSVRHDMSSPA
jgi:hypothetical protein